MQRNEEKQIKNTNTMCWTLLYANKYK